ncbi:hypothetical protein SADUNF_Sadunf13G0078400 [Salix dunnii]|uniref:GCK domain-containing protein n=1 Tax=Salix dunnii TaxID=1413687 RepID=A0A835JHU0_9ROSI|nr:hypothetical protein SADUNF_Sadunf13G0078400 [Salix dunnii]
MGGVSSSRTNPNDSYKSNLSPSSSIPGNSQNHNSSTTSSNLPLSSDFSVATETPEASDQSKKPIDANGDEGQEVEEEEEEEGECGFCVYMKGGGCKDAFIAWEDCVKEAEDNNEDIVEKCREVTRSLTKCMEAHTDYYEPILKAEKAAKEEAVNELKVKTAKESESNVAEKEAVIVVDMMDREVMKDSGDHK